jgi:hypothetical protein
MKCRFALAWVSLASLAGCAAMDGLVAGLTAPAPEARTVASEAPALVAEKATPLGKATRIRFDLSRYGTTYNTATGYPYSPATHQNTYSQRPQFPLLVEPDGSLSVVWQDQRGGGVFRTRLPAAAASGGADAAATLQLAVPGGQLLAACAGAGGDLYCLTSAGTMDPQVAITRLDSQGRALRTLALSGAKEQLNVNQIEDGIANLAFGDGRLAMVLGRRMQKSADGLNHQGSIAATFPADLSATMLLGQNSGHSFDNKVIFDAGAFVSADLGDNYPRGVILHRFFEKKERGRVVFTYKTNHGDGPSPYRKDKSGRPLAAGRWSNDNRTYTELGGVRRTPSGYAVLIASERSIDNGKARDYLNEARNLACVVVAPDFAAAAQEANVVTDRIVTSKGESSADFGFYTFDGDYVRQKRTGVVWLTDYRDLRKDNVSRPKLEHLGGGRLLALWEKWTPVGFVSTWAMTFDETGKPSSAPVELGTAFRLQRGDDVARVAGRVVWITGYGRGLELNVLEVGGAR